MGCAASRRIHKEERVQRCKERKRLMKQLVGLRREFAAAQMAYLQALKNTGVTLRQFTEAESPSFELHPCPSFDDNDDLSHSPPPPPPPPPPLSFDDLDESAEIIDDEEEDSSCSTPPPPPLLPSSSWDFWDPFGPSSCSSTSPIRHNKNETAVQQVEEEDWAETNTEFAEEEEGEEKGEDKVVATDAVLKNNPPAVIELVDDTSSTVSGCTKETAEMALVSRRRRSKKTLSGIVKEIDEYFLKIFDSGREIAVLLDINRGDSLYQKFGESTGKRCKSAKVCSALSWNWSFKSLHSSKDAVEFHGPYEPCKPGAHSITLDKLYTEEERLYKELKEEENTKLEYERKALLLQKQEAGDHDLLKTEEIRSSIESLQSDISCLQQSINKTCSSILKLRDDDLHPQLVELSSRLMHMWRTMYECHQAQNHLAQQMNHLTNHPSMEPTTDYHRQATAQLETEVNAWYNTFCNLVKFQRQYVGVLNRWVQLSDYLVVDQQQSDHSSSGVQTLCEEWQLAQEKFPDKVASEAIKSFVSVIHSMVLQQAEERILQKKSDQLEKRLHKELNSLSEMEKKFERNLLTGEMVSNLSPNHPFLVKRARTEAFKKRVDDEKAKYLNSVHMSRAMTLNNLQTCLPNVFQAMTGFSSACAQAFEAVDGCCNKSTARSTNELQFSFSIL